MGPGELEGGEADARTDIFALGAVIYEMVTGRRAFEGKSHASLIAAILGQQPPRISALQPSSPPAMEHALETCLAKYPEDRWQTARDFHHELKWIAAGGGVSPVSAPADVACLRKRQRLGWIVAGCSLFTLIPVVAAVYLRPAPEARVVQFDVTLPGETASERLFDHSVSPDGQYVAMITGATGQD